MDGLSFLQMMRVAFGRDLNAIPDDKFAAALDRWHVEPVEPKSYGSVYASPTHQCHDMEDIRKCPVCSIM